MRSKQQPRPSFRWPQQRGDNLTGKYPYVTSHARTQVRTHERTYFHYFTLHPAFLTSRDEITASPRVPRSGIPLARERNEIDRRLTDARTRRY